MFTSVPKYVHDRWVENPNCRAYQVYSDFLARYGSLHTTQRRVRQYLESFKNGDTSSLNQPKTIPVVQVPNNQLPEEIDLPTDDDDDDQLLNNGHHNSANDEVERMSQDGDNEDVSDGDDNIDNDNEEETSSGDEEDNSSAPLFEELLPRTKRAFILYHFMSKFFLSKKCI